MRVLIKNIGLLAGIDSIGTQRLQGEEMNHVETISNAWLLIEEGRIAAFGKRGHGGPEHVDRTINAGKGVVMPAFCDSHTHVVHAGDRTEEFAKGIKAYSYVNFVCRGDGIRHTVDLTRRSSERELYESAKRRLWEMMSFGTGSVEIKSGYGLTPKDELKILRVVRRLKEELPMTIRATFYGAHVVPDEYAECPDCYVDLICREMIPAVAVEGLADFVDVSCDRGLFTSEQTLRILECGMEYGLRPKLHTNLLSYSEGVEIGVKYRALSVDHLEHTGPDEISVLHGTETMATILPGTSFFLNVTPAPARAIIDSGLGVALASDYDPGLSPSGNMSFVWSLACISSRMTPQEAFNAITLNGAYAMGISAECGSIRAGKRADLLITEPVPSFEYIPYAYGKTKVAHLILGGEKIY